DAASHLRDTPSLRGPLAVYRVDAVGQVLPGPGHAADLRLPPELAFGPDLPGHAGDLRGEAVELINHGVDGVLQFQDLAPHVDGDLLREVTIRHRRSDIGDIADLGREIA